MSRYQYEKFRLFLTVSSVSISSCLSFSFSFPHKQIFCYPSLVVVLFYTLILLLQYCSLLSFGNGSCGDLWVGVNWPWTTKEMLQSCGQKNNFRDSERERRAYFLWVWQVLIEESVFLMEEVVCLWMEGGLCRGTEEGALGEKGLSGFVGLGKERWGRKVYRVLEKPFFAFMFFFFFFFNILLTQKIVEASKAPILYIFIYIYINYYI